jgi:two-component system, sporulation sensor kinase E
VAHEIGNPLNSLTIHLQLLERELRGLTERAGGAAEGVGGGVAARGDAAGPDHQPVPARGAPDHAGFEKASLGAVLQQTLEFLKHEVKDRDILVEVDQPDDLPDAMLDRNQIKQVFFNIIRNAMQAMPQGGLLKITLGSNDRFVSIAFKDTGPGIPADQLGSIFEPYFTTKSEGTGLGLMIVQRIVRDHGGEIEVHSEPQQVGTTFTLFLPRDARRIRLLLFSVQSSGRRLQSHRPLPAEL